MAPKSVLITGSSEGGIGNAFALAFQQRGLTVFATARSLKKMTNLASLPNVHLIALDVSSSESIAAVAKEVQVKTDGKLDILLNNAGGNFKMPVLDLDIEAAKDIFEVNYWAPIRMVQAFSNMLIAAKGTIVNVGSIAGELPIPFQATYNASKAALNMMSETMRMELAPLNVKVVTVMAGNVTSNIGSNTPEVVLPSTSRYLSIQTKLNEKVEYNDMPTMEFVNVVAHKALGGATGKMWKGSNTAIVRWLVPMLPSSALDFLMYKLSAPLQQVPKL